MRLRHQYSFFYICFLLLLSSCSEKPNTAHTRTVRIAATEDPSSLDPRLVRDLPSSTFLHMLYEGLMRADSDGKLVMGAAENVSISEDKKTYTFTIRKAEWSDGTPVTANDFEKAWKSILSPKFAAPNAYQLYLIKGAKEAKDGLQSVDEISVKATDLHTLVVELNQPVPYFLEMTACHFFFPVHSKALSDEESLDTLPGDTLPGNGPFRIATWNKRNSIILDKNLKYWDAQNVELNQIELVVLDENTALQLFKSKELDWAGSPLSVLPQDAITNLKKNGELKISDGAGTHFVRTNTERYPFNHAKIRKAFAMAVDRQAIVDHITQGNQQPAFGIVPPAFNFGNRSYFKDNDVDTAQKLFNEVLSEENITKEDLPTLLLSYAANDRNHKIAQSLQQQWNKAFGISLNLEASELQTYLDKIRSKDYFLALGSWYADIEDPINFLEVFKSKDNPTNQTGWQNEEYITVLEASSSEMNLSTRINILKNAEKIFIEEMPVIPLYHSAYNYLKRSDVENVFFSPLGYLDFKYARISDTAR